MNLPRGLRLLYFLFISEWWGIQFLPSFWMHNSLLWDIVEETKANTTKLVFVPKVCTKKTKDKISRTKGFHIFGLRYPSAWINIFTKLEITNLRAAWVCDFFFCLKSDLSKSRSFLSAREGWGY